MSMFGCTFLKDESFLIKKNMLENFLEIDGYRFVRVLQRAEESRFANRHDRDIVKLKYKVVKNGEDAEERI